MKKLSGLPEIIWKERYSHEGEECWNDTAKRVSQFVAKEEDDKSKWSDEFYSVISKMKFIPGGRILANSGRQDAQLLNCFVIPIEDSREKIGQAVKDYLVISGTGGGVGLSFRNIRYKGAPIKRAGGVSSGSVSFMDVINAVADTIKIGGGRRAATMLSLPCDHPDIVEFIHHKLDEHKLNNANVSVEVTEKFLQAVRDDDMWDLMWEGEVVNSIKATQLWKLIVNNAVESGEPGILNFELFEKQSNSWYFNKISCTNPCGEIGLPNYGVCCLGSLNINEFVVESDGDISVDWDDFKKSAAIAIRFLDNVLDINTFPLEKCKEQAQNERRIGLGLMGIHSAMLQLGIKYSSDEGLSFIEMCYSKLRDASYEASISLAEEKGSFPEFDADLFLDSGYSKTLPNDIRKGIKTYGIRNVCCNTQAPTGTTALLCGVSSGIEPIFAPLYIRRFFSDQSETGRKEEVTADAELLSALEKGKSFSELTHFEGAYDVPVEQHFKAQMVAQKYIDNSVSKTLNLPASFSACELEELLLKYGQYLKGTTIYRAGSRGYEPLSPLEMTPKNLQLAKDGLTTCSDSDTINKAKESADQALSIECPNGVCEL
jgi:ribonucleoside-diphosphate reductase alpha chain